MKVTFLVAGFFIICSQLLSQTPQIKWWYDVNDMSFGNSAIADMDNDGLPEIAFSTYRNDSTLHVLNAEDGSLLWQYNTGGCNDVAPLIWDVDMDEHLEVVLPSSCVAKTFCFDAATGNLEWEINTHGSDSPPTVADLDNDGKLEILHGQFNGYVICINGEDGTMNWEINPDPNSWIQTAPAILDADNDGQLDFIIANWSFGSNHKIFAFRGNDHSLLWEADYPNDVIYHGGSFADLDNDGYMEIAFGSYDGALNVLNCEDGSLLWDFSFSSSYYMGAPTSIADFNNDGFLEIIVFDWYQVGLISHEGQLLWNYSIPGNGSSFRGAAVSNVNGDQYLDAVFGTSNGLMIALSGSNGNPVWTVDLADHFTSGDFDIDHGPVIRDFDDDGLLDAFLVGGHAEYPNIQNNYGRAYAVSLEAAGGPGWTMFRHDERRSGCLCDTSFVSAEELKIVKPEIIQLSHEGRIALRNISLIENKPRLIIFDINGRVVFNEIVKKRTIDLANLKNGIYAALLQSKELVVKKKIIICR